MDGEGCFYAKLSKTIAKSSITGFVPSLRFSISQHERDKVLLTKFIDYLGCVRIDQASTRQREVTFAEHKYRDIVGKIIPFFQSYPLQGIKNMDYQDFCAIAKIMENKSHLTPEGLNKIKSLKSGMNRGRRNN